MTIVGVTIPRKFLAYLFQTILDKSSWDTWAVSRIPHPPNQCWKISRFLQQKRQKSPDYQHWKWGEGRTCFVSQVFSLGLLVWFLAFQIPLQLSNISRFCFILIWRQFWYIRKQIWRWHADGKFKKVWQKLCFRSSHVSSCVTEEKWRTVAHITGISYTWWLQSMC